jgi:predicted esterase
MSWLQFPDGLRLDQDAKGSPEALVVLLRDASTTAATLIPIAQRWAAAVPTTAFVALEILDPIGASFCGPIDGNNDPALFDRATRHLEPLLEQELRFHHLDASRLVLVGFRYGGTLALHMVLVQGWSCAGVLAFNARLVRPLPRILRIGRKIRLIESVPPAAIAPNHMCDLVAQLTARGIDTRGVLLDGSALSDQALRHGAAYLVELVATAQRGDHLHVSPESSHAQ